MSLRKRLSRVKEICRRYFIHFRQAEKSVQRECQFGVLFRLTAENYFLEIVTPDISSFTITSFNFSAGIFKSISSEIFISNRNPGL